ncbi:MAG: hypothetical protein MCSN_0220 [Candidatus Microsyncoccus archaeolyticus]|jgi:hypothetical protein|nr:MAG: hypothetical protein MCSN_0220 [Candidatus Parcubacteria bacterium]
MKKYIILILVLLLIGISFVLLNNKQEEVQKINGMIMLIEFEKIEGVLQWEKELDSRNLNALVKVQDNVLKEYPDVFKRLSDKGYEIAGGYDVAPFWDMPYEEQYEYLKEAQDLIKEITGKEMRVFGSRYFAYDENTLKAADALGIPYILARGTQDVKAAIYSPNEYNVKIISVSNIVFEDMGSGSLCDYSLWARGASPEEFDKVVEDSIIKNPPNMILVSHAYLGGTRLAWWNAYEKALNSDKITWKKFNEWIDSVPVSSLSNTEIPINKEVKYVAPKPVTPIEDFEPIPDLEEETFCPTCF